MSFLFIPGRSARISNLFSNCCRHKTSRLRTDASHNKFVTAQQAYLHHIKVHVPAALAGSVSNVSSGVPERSKNVLTTAERRQCHVVLWRQVCNYSKTPSDQSPLAPTQVCFTTSRFESGETHPHHHHPPLPQRGFSDFSFLMNLISDTRPSRVTHLQSLVKNATDRRMQAC